MLKKLLPKLALLLLLPAISFAQTCKITGTLTDTSNFKPLAYSVATLIRKDSVITQFQHVNMQNKFEFTRIEPDTYKLLITHRGFADYEEDLILKPGEEKNLGVIYMVSRENLLREVLIKDRSAIKIKGDTIEFLVDSFLTNKNSNVEDLLKRLPGIQVDKNGKITAQGQEVKRVLVDGEEFFGNDPTVATKNLKAENVETVQVFDKKSEQAVNTGIDDGTKEKTINLTLKADAKKGYFGKVGAGLGTKNNSSIPDVPEKIGTEHRYEGEAMVNNFKDKRKISFFSTLSNTNKTGLNWDDRDKYMGGNNVEYDESTGYMYTYFEGDPGSGDGSGIPQTRYIGGFYSDKFGKDQNSTASVTGTNKNSIVKGIQYDKTQYILPDTMYFNTQKKVIDNNRNTSSIKGKSELKFDSLTTLTIKANLTQSTFDNISDFTVENRNSLSQLVNKNNRNTTTDGNTLNGNYSLYFNRKFMKAGRSFAIGFDQKLNQNNSNTKLFSETVFYNGDSTINGEQNLDQLRKVTEKGNGVGGNISYTEPILKKLFLVGNYDLHYTQNSSTINTFNKIPSGGYISRVDSLSNQLNYNISIQKGELLLRYINKKINASIGGKISETKLTQENVLKDTTVSQHFINYFPSARINYKFNSSRSFTFTYSGSTKQPTLQQINPIQNLSNPLIISRGNANLTQSFSNQFSINYNSYKALTGRSLWMSASFNQTSHDFATYYTVDNQGRSVYQTVNVEGNRSADFYTYYYFSIKKLHLGFGNSLNGEISKNANFINGLANTNNNIELNYDLNIDFNIEEKINVYGGPGVQYSQTKTTLRKDVVTDFYTYKAYLGIDVFLPKKFTWELEGDWTKRQSTAVFKGYENLIINAKISRKFLKSEDLICSFSINDLLNRNIGFNRNATTNYVSESMYTVLRRYFMISLTYNFKNKTPKAEKTDE